MNNNVLLMTDSYKVSHWKQYPKDTTNIYSYFESRGGQFGETVFFGLQYILKYLSNPITQKDIDEAEDYCAKHFGSASLFNRESWEYILKQHGGYLPVHIKAVPEGTVVKTKNVLMTIENTDPNCFWLTNYLETILSQIWYPITVATLSRETKKLIVNNLKETGSIDGANFKLHDFGFRGASSLESAAIGGAAHLINFVGTDNLPAVVFARDHYDEDMAGFSIPASEHSTITSWTEQGEIEAYRNMINEYGDNPFYACVSDSYNIWRACSDLWGGELKDAVTNAKGTLVVRPDSGDPPFVVLRCLQLLGEAFGTTKNPKGYKVLNPKVRLIQGDGCNYQSIRKILSELKINGWSGDNVAFGMGGGLLQKVDRDTQKFAFKCSPDVL